jgi:hypothetical protein
MTTHYRMILIVPKALVGTVLEVLDPESEMVSIVPDEARTKKGHLRLHTNHKTNRGGYRKRRVGETGRDIILGMLPATSADMIKAFVTKGRAGNSVSPLTSTLQAEGKIKLNDDGKWSTVR